MLSTDCRRPALLAVTAFTVLFGMQCLRMWMPLLVFLLRDRLRWTSPQLAGLALGIFLLGCLAPLAARRFGLRRTTWMTVGGLALARLEIQLWQGDPFVDLIFVCVGVVAFVLAAPTLLLVARSGDSEQGEALAAGWLAGLVADLVFFSLYGTWDIAWRRDLLSLLLVLALVVAAVVALRLVTARLGEDDPVGLDAAGVAAWVGVWPLLFLFHWSFSNPARLAELSRLSTTRAGFVLASLLAAGLLAHSMGWTAAWPRIARMVSALILVISCLRAWHFGPSAVAVYGLGALAAGVASCLLLTAAATSASPRVSSKARRLVGLVLGHALSMVLFFVLTFAFSSGWDIHLPMGADRVPLLAALVSALCLLVVARKRRPARGSRLPGVALLSVLVLASGGFVIAWPDDADTRGTGTTTEWPLRVVTYNVHCGIDPSGRLDLEAIAATLESEKPDVIVLQEVSRGWMLNGSVDLAGWLSRRLDIPYVFHGTGDPTWGNAVMTRLPIASARRFELPPRDLLLRRGYLDVELRVGDSDRLRVLATHLHHPRRGGKERIVQSRRMVEAWDGTTRTLLAGDLNALPGEAEIEFLRDAGFRDALDLAGDAPGFTYPSWQPVRRIDYVWLSPDLDASEAWVSPSTASDHAAVVATIRPME